MRLPKPKKPEIPQIGMVLLDKVSLTPVDYRTLKKDTSIPHHLRARLINYYRRTTRRQVSVM